MACRTGGLGSLAADPDVMFDFEDHETQEIDPWGAKSSSTLHVPATYLAPSGATRSHATVTSILDEFNLLVRRHHGSAAGDTGGSEGPVEVTVEDLAKHWQDLVSAARRGGRLRSSPPHQQVIALRVAQFMQDMDLKRKGSVTQEEWLHYMLLARSGFATRQVNGLLDKAMIRNKTILVDLQRMFDTADSTKSGTLSLQEIMSMYSRHLWQLRPSQTGASKNMTMEELKAGDPEEFAREVIQAMDIKGDEKVTYSEFMAYSLGRRKHEVLLHLYDLSNGAARSISPWLIGRELEGVWHTGVVVYGKEYYYSKDTVYADAGDTSFGKPTRIVRLGYTLWRQDELHEFVTAELKPVFQRETYDVVCNNCNHFSERVSMFLVGKHLPTEVLNQPDILLQARTIRWARPILNWWLRDRIVVRENGVALPQGVRRLTPQDQPAPGTTVSIHAASGIGAPILGQIVSPDSREMDGEFMGPSIMHSSNGNANYVATVGGLSGLGGGSGSAAASASPGSNNGCHSLWTGTCGVVKTSNIDDPVPGHWVAYLDVPLPASGLGALQVRVERFPCERLSLGGLKETEGEALYLRALRAIGGLPPSRRGPQMSVPASTSPISPQTASESVPSRPHMAEFGQGRSSKLGPCLTTQPPVSLQDKLVPDVSTVAMSTL